MDNCETDGTDLDNQSATIAIDVDSPAEHVWEALTTNDGLAPWLGDGAKIEPVPGGHVAAPDPVTNQPKTGEVHTVVENEELGFHWWPDDSPQHASDVRITITPQQQRSTITITETPRHLSTAPTAVAATRTTGFAPGFTGRSSRASTAKSAQTRLIAAWEWRGALITVAQPGATPVMQPSVHSPRWAGSTVVYC